MSSAAGTLRIAVTEKNAGGQPATTRASKQRIGQLRDRISALASPDVIEMQPSPR